jgi:CHAD domain-containing protein
VTRPAEEVELKYDAFDLDALAGWLDAHFAPAEGAGWQTVELTDRYIDTAGHDLARAGYGARLRASGGGVELTVKSDLEVKEARHRRLEMSGPATDSLDPAAWPPSPALEIVLEAAAGRPLRERFTIVQRRRERTLALGGAEVVVSLDEARVCLEEELLGSLIGAELELLKGRRRSLRALARNVAESGMVRAQPLSKMQLASAMVAARQPLESAEPVGEAARKVLGRHLARLIEREAATRAGDALALKQMRVAARRLRSAWRVFDGTYKRPVQRRQVAGLRDLGGRLGAVRDLDVLLTNLPDDLGLTGLAAAWRSERESAMTDLVGYLDSAGFASMKVDALRLAGSPATGVARRAADRRLHDVAGARIVSACLAMRADGDALGTADPAALHSLRISAKRLRYALETFRDLLAEEELAPPLRSLISLQDVLGALNDAAIAASRAADWLDVASPDELARDGSAVEDHVAACLIEMDERGREASALWSVIAGPVFARQIDRLAAKLTAS